MHATLYTLIYAAPRSGVDELMKVRKILGDLMGKKFVEEADFYPDAGNKIVSLIAKKMLQIAANINIKIPEEGEKVLKLAEIARDKNIEYFPSEESLAVSSLTFIS